MTAFEILESLQTEIGARRAGTEGERRVQEWLKAYSEKLGLFVEMPEADGVGIWLVIGIGGLTNCR